ncbi:MAG: hypothetical protein JSS29_08610 [Proteobacteria bacterium]|nr:hypothetical protein [Pseudomonadota bacterium]
MRSAAAALLWKLAGERTGINTAPPPAPATTTADRYVSEMATRRLARMLAEGPRELVEEWLDIAARSGGVLAPQWVPAVFQALAPAARTRYARVLGARIEWLAAQDARWAIEGCRIEWTEDAWTSGTQAERAALLMHVRQAEPERGRALLESTWTIDSPESRERFVGVLRIGLSAADEAFLEAALDDKRKSVRSSAADLLKGLPASAYVRRVLDRLQPLFVLEARGTGLISRFSGRKLRLELPAALDKAALRDGMETKPPATRKIGERAWWLMQMIEAIPPVIWTQRFDCTEAELLSAVDATDYSDDLCHAFTAACVRHPEHRWVQGLCAEWRRRLDRPDVRAAAIDSIARLIAVVPPPDGETLLGEEVGVLRSQGAVDAAAELLVRLTLPWSSASTRIALEVLELRVGGTAPQGTLPRTTLDLWAWRANPASAIAPLSALLERLPPDSPWRNALERFRELIEFRSNMHKELLA